MDGPGLQLPDGGPPPARWWRWVAALAALRVAIPLVVLAAEGHDLPLVPRYDYVPLRGDATGFYAAMRALVASAVHVHPVLILLELVVLALAVAVVVRERRGRRRGWPGLLAVSAALALGAVLVVLELPGTTGAAVVGWPLLLAVPLFPFRVVGLGPGPDLTFAVGLVLSLAAVAATTVASAVLGRRLTGRPAVGLAAAALWALWPLVMGPLAGSSAFENGQWDVVVGLALYTEPVSTALVACALALVAGRQTGDVQACVAGALLGLATAVKLSNGLLLALAVVVLAVARPAGPRRAALAAVAGAVWLPLVAAYWPKGYVGMFGGQIAASEKPFSLANVGPGWGDSLLFTPRLLAVLVPLLLVGLLLAVPRARVLLGVAIALTAGFYSLYQPFADHPRFLDAVVPAAFVLVAIALVRAGDAVAAARDPGGLRASG